MNRCKIAERDYPQVKTSTDINAALDDDRVSAVIIVLPARLHYNIAKMALMKRKHVLIEKPLTSSVLESKELIEIAKNHHLVLMVDHTYLYSASINKMKEILTGKNNSIKHIESNRSNLGLFRNDVNVIWDLAPHDLSIIEYLSESKPKKVSAVGYSHNKLGIVDTAYISLIYDDFTAGVKVSWISPKKERQITIVTNENMIVFDDLLKEGKIELHSAGFKETDKGITCWNEGMQRISATEKEPLSTMLDDFIDAIETGKEPISNSAIGLDIVRILEATELSLSKDGMYVRVCYN